jgi:hypothetical protein
MGARIPLFGLGQLAKSPYVTAKYLQNLYVEARPQGEKSQLVAYGTPGELLFHDFGATPCRGGLEFEPGNVAYVVHRGVLWEINNAGVAVSRGTLSTTTGRVSISHNGLQVMIVDGTNGYIYNTNTTVFTQVASALFANPVTVTYLGRRFVCSFLNSSRFQWSSIDDGLTFGALDFANAETSPDPIEVIFASNGQLVLLGSITSEYWGISSTADQPFAPLQGTATEWGIAATWSIAKYDNTFAYLVKNRMGQTVIAKLNGYLPQPLSNVDMDSIVNAYSNTADASAYSYMLGGHPMFVLNFPSAGKSWLYDGSTGEFTALKSFGSTRHNAEFSFTLLGRTIVADAVDGKLYELTAAALTDNGASIEREIVSETVADPMLDFIDISCLRVDIEVGVGTTTGQGVNPQIGLSVSRDNGRTWGAQMWKTMGAIGQYLTQVEWRRLGTPKQATFKITVTDPVPVNIVSGILNPSN